jgi:hypothetical protein
MDDSGTTNLLSIQSNLPLITSYQSSDEENRTDDESEINKTSDLQSSHIQECESAPGRKVYITAKGKVFPLRQSTDSTPKSKRSSSPLKEPCNNTTTKKARALTSKEETSMGDYNLSDASLLSSSSDDEQPLCQLALPAQSIQPVQKAKKIQKKPSQQTSTPAQQNESNSMEQFFQQYPDEDYPVELTESNDEDVPPPMPFSNTKRQHYRAWGNGCVRCLSTRQYCTVKLPCEPCQEAGYEGCYVRFSDLRRRKPRASRKKKNKAEN